MKQKSCVDDQKKNTTKYTHGKNGSETIPQDKKEKRETALGTHTHNSGTGLLVAFGSARVRFPVCCGRTNGTVYFSACSQSNKSDCASNGRRNKAGLVERSWAGAEPQRVRPLFFIYSPPLFFYPPTHQPHPPPSLFVRLSFGHMKRTHEFHFHFTCTIITSLLRQEKEEKKKEK